MSILNRILGALRGASGGGHRTPGAGRPAPGGTPHGGGIPTSGRGLLSRLLSSRRGGRGRI
jgi:hypothetical protein